MALGVKSARCCILLAVAAAPLLASADDLSSTSGYCDFVGAVAESESLPLMGPQVFTRFGLVNGKEAIDPVAPPRHAPSMRVTAGLSYSFARLHRGLTLRRRAEAECRRFRAESALREATQLGMRLGMASALVARADVIRAALPGVEQSVADLKRAVAAGDATLDELNVLNLRVADLREQLRRAELELAQLGTAATAPEIPLRKLWADLASAQMEAEDLTAALRNTTTWDIALHGGYDRLLSEQTSVPWFAMVTLSYDLGALAQSSADERARQGLRRWLDRGGPVADHGFGRLLGELRATLRSERARLSELTLLVAELGAQLGKVEGLQTVHVRRFRETLKVELATLRADQAYLEAHVAALARMLPEEE